MRYCDVKVVEGPITYYNVCTNYNACTSHHRYSCCQRGRKPHLLQYIRIIARYHGVKVVEGPIHYNLHTNYNVSRRFYLL
jgi:hypothetical protein